MTRRDLLHLCVTRVLGAPLPVAFSFLFVSNDQIGQGALCAFFGQA